MADGGHDRLGIALEGRDEAGFVQIGAMGDDGVSAGSARRFARNAHFIEGGGILVIATADGVKVREPSDEPTGRARQPIDGKPERGKRCEFLGLVRSVLVDASSGGKQSDEGALGGERLGFPPGEAGGGTPGLHRAVE